MLSPQSGRTPAALSETDLNVRPLFMQSTLAVPTLSNECSMRRWCCELRCVAATTLAQQKPLNYCHLGIAMRNRPAPELRFAGVSRENNGRRLTLGGQLADSLLAARNEAFFRAAASVRPRRFSKAACAASQRGFNFFRSVCPWG